MVGARSGIVGDMVIPNEGLAPALARDVREMFDRICIGNDLLTGPKEIDAGIDDLPEILQIGFRRGPKLTHEPRIVRIVRWTNDEALRTAPGTDICEHLRLQAG